MRKPLLLCLVCSLPTLAADQSWSTPLLTVGNKWIMTDAAKEFEVSIARVSPLAGAQVATVAIKQTKGEASSTTLSACVMRTARGLFVISSGCDQASEVKAALKRKPPFSEPPKAYSRRLNAPSEEMPETEAVTLGKQAVAGAEVNVASYAYAADMGFSVDLAQGVGFAKLSWDLQEGGGTLTLQRFIAVDPAVPATWEALGIETNGRKVLEEAGGGLTATGSFGPRDVPLTAVLHGDAANTELLVLGPDAKVLFTQTFKKHGPRGLRAEAATGELSVFFDLGDFLEATAKTLSWDEKKKRFTLVKRSDEAE